MDAGEARTVAERFLAENVTYHEPVALFAMEPEDRQWCFLFYWNTARYVQTGDMTFNIGPGTGPIAVVKSTGDAWALGSVSFDLQLAEYARTHAITTD